MPQHYVVRGYHGTTLSRAQSIIANQQIQISRNDYDWLGHGAYFFQDGPLRAWKWAVEWVVRRHGGQPAVISADISLEDCFDLLDIANWNYLLAAHQVLSSTAAAPSQTSPVVRNHTGRRFHIASPAPVSGRSGHNKLDCAVVKMAVNVRRRRQRVQSVRGAFVEGQQLYNNSYFFDHSHVQIAVLEPNAIIPTSFVLEDANALSSAYALSGMTRWPV